MENHVDLESGYDEVENVKRVENVLSITDIKTQAKIFFNLHRGINDENLGGLDEAKCFKILKNSFAEDPRVSFRTVSEGGNSVEFALIKSLEKVGSFFESVIPIVCSDPDKIALGFHETPLYWAEKIANEGLKGSEINPGGFYIHPERYLGETFVDIAARSFFYANKHNWPSTREEAFEHQLRFFPPKEVVEGDFRNARVLTVALKESYTDRDQKGEPVDFSDFENVPYEMVIAKPLSPDSLIITNVWHPYLAISECEAKGVRTVYTLDGLKKIYDKYKIDLKTGVRRKD